MTYVWGNQLVCDKMVILQKRRPRLSLLVGRRKGSCEAAGGPSKDSVFLLVAERSAAGEDVCPADRSLK